MPSDLVKRIIEVYESETWLFRNKKVNKPVSRQYVNEKLGFFSQEYLGRPLHPHQFRHTFATKKVKENRDVKSVSLYLGHSSTSITLDMYVHTSLSPKEALS